MLIHRRAYLVLMFASAAFSSLFGADGPPSSKLSVGFAAVDITPRLGTPMAGYYSPRGTEGVHDPLLAKVMVQVFTIGNQAAIVSLPGEIFVELGISIRQGSPFPLTAVAELANGSIGYIPNRVAYPQGEYEVISARVAEGSGEQLVDAALDMLRALYLKEAAKP